MSRMMLRSNAKPPLARSPIRLRSRRIPLQPAAAFNSPPGPLTKSVLPKRCSDVEQSGVRGEYHTISCELKALAKMVHQELGTKNDAKFGDDDSLRMPLFERGRFYDEYCARRNERLKRKKGETADGFEKKKPAYDLGVRVESSKKREVSKLESRRKAAAATPMTEARTTRYSLRSTSKENKKPPIPMPMPMPMMMHVEKSVGITERKSGVRRTTTRKA
ncbi:hypothetical protein ACS0TY_013591 [Phlomoides rotata]